MWAIRSLTRSSAVRGGVAGGIVGVFLAILVWQWFSIPHARKEKRHFHMPEIEYSGQTNLLVTGYCNCGGCCGWKRSWFGLGKPVYATGRLKGKPKKVGFTASGRPAKWGTIAADRRVFPFGTRLRVPGYGEGIVEDVGGAIQGRHIDVWFPTHAEALAWGRRWLNVEWCQEEQIKTRSAK